MAKAGYVPPIGSSMQLFYAKMYKAVKDPAFVKAATAKTAGETVSYSEAQALIKGAKSYSVPATAMKGLVRGAGAAATAVSGLQLGFDVTTGIMNMFGVDTADMACQSDAGAGLVSLIYGQTAESCAAAYAQPPGWTPDPGQLVKPKGFLKNTFTWGANYYGAGKPYFECIVLDTTSPITGGLSMNCKVTFRPAGTAGQTLDTASNHRAWCRSATGVMTSLGVGTLKTAAGSSSWKSGDGDVIWKNPCAAGSTLYSVNLSSTDKDKIPTLADGQGSLPFSYFSPYSPSAEQFPQSINDPLRRLECIIAASNGQTYSAVTGQYRDSNGTLPAVKCPELPQGVNMVGIKVESVTETGERTNLLDQTTTPEYQKLTTDFPECGTGACILDLRKSSTNKSCFMAPDACADWFADPNKTENYKCRYGEHSVTLSECNIYAPTFQEEAVKTGKTVLGDIAQTTPVPRADPTPETGDQPSPCWPTGWGVFNPLAWVLQPLQCAFVPRPSVVTNAVIAGNMSQAQTPPGQWIRAITAFQLPAGPSGCNGVSVNVGWLSDLSTVPLPGIPRSVKVLAACPGDPLQPYAVASSLILVIGFCFIAFRAAAALIGRFATFGGIGG